MRTPIGRELLPAYVLRRVSRVPLLRLFCCFLLMSLALDTATAQVLNVTQAGLLEGFTGKKPNLTGATAVYTQGNYCYVVGTGDVLEILDITLPGLPAHKGSLATGEGGASI